MFVRIIYVHVFFSGTLTTHPSWLRWHRGGGGGSRQHQEAEEAEQPAPIIKMAKRIFGYLFSGCSSTTHSATHHVVCVANFSKVVFSWHSGWRRRGRRRRPCDVRGGGGGQTAFYWVFK